MDQSHNPRRGALLGALALLLFLLPLWWQASRWYSARLLAERRAEAALETSLRGNIMSSIINRRFARLQGLSAFVEAEAGDPDFTDAFEAFAERLYYGSSGIRGFSLAPGGEVRYIYPEAGNGVVLGYRPLYDPRPEVRVDVRRAMRTGNVVLSGPTGLLQGGLGLIARQAVYQDGTYWGLVSVILDVANILEEAGINDPAGGLNYAVRDSAGRVFAGEPDIFEQDPVINVVELPEGAWEVAAVPVVGWPATLQPALQLFQLGSLAVVLLLTAISYLAVNRQVRLQQAVRQRTRELAAANRLLEERVHERTRQLETLLQVAQDITSTLQIEPLLGMILDQLQAVVAYSAGALYLYENTNGQTRLRLLHFTGPRGQERATATDSTLYWPPAQGEWPEVRRQQAPLIIHDLHVDVEPARSWHQAAQLFGFSLEDVQSLMSVPLKLQDKVVGLLVVGHPQTGHFTEADAALALAFASQAAIAIENARLYEQARSLAVLQERQRLARELHDSVSQAIYGIALGTLTARRLAAQGRTAEVDASLEYAHGLAGAALAEMRALIFELRPESLQQEGLVAALEKQAAALRVRYQIAVDIDVCQEPDAALAIKEVLYRVAQEALHNVVKHAGADHVTLRLLCDNRSLELLVRDNGCGFTPDQVFPGHLGLRSMRERIEQVRGTLTVTSRPGEGAEIRARVPVR